MTASAAAAWWPPFEPTLETGEQQAAARKMKIHPNTLRYRLDRIREVTGAELEEPETRLNLAVALRVQSLLGLLSDDEG